MSESSDNFTMQPAHCRRRHGRLRQEAMWTNYGPVLDFSATGMRVRTRWPVRRRVIAIEVHGTSEAIIIPCEVVWRKRVGMLFGHELGLRFLEPDAKTVQQFTSLARNRAAVGYGVNAAA